MRGEHTRPSTSASAASPKQSDPVGDTWWRILSVAVAAGLFTFVLGVLAAAFRGPGWLGIILLGVLAAAAVVALVGAATLWRRPAR